MKWLLTALIISGLIIVLIEFVIAPKIADILVRISETISKKR